MLRSGDDAVRWIEHAQQEHVLQLAGRRLPALPGADPLGDAASHDGWARSVLQSFESFRLLCAVREGEWGVGGLNAAIEQRLESARLIRRRGEWYVGRPVMVTRNDYGTRVFNGDIGLTLADPARPDSLRVYFLEGDEVRSVLATRLRHVETAFAMTVHKSQGSEFAHTVLVLPKVGRRRCWRASWSTPGSRGPARVHAGVAGQRGAGRGDRPQDPAGQRLADDAGG